ncbi:MAG: DUF1697 domain-containing protein [Flavobacteriales bacterium]
MVFIALLRGINVGGHKKILMKDLKTLFEKQGFNNVQTFIQSGNVVFSTSEAKENLSSIISKAILYHYNFEVPVVIKTPLEIKKILEHCPFSEEKKVASYFTLFSTKPKQEQIDHVNHLSFPNEEFLATPHCFYFYCSTGYRKVKMNNNFLERKFKISMTTRNFKTLNKLLTINEI